MKKKEARKMFKRLCNEVEQELPVEKIINQTDKLRKKPSNSVNPLRRRLVFATIFIFVIALNSFIWFKIGYDNFFKTNNDCLSDCLLLDNRQLLEIKKYTSQYCDKVNNKCILKSSVDSMYDVCIYEGYQDEKCIMYFYTIVIKDGQDSSYYIQTNTENIALEEGINYGILYDEIDDLDIISFKVIIGDYERTYYFSK